MKEIEIKILDIDYASIVKNLISLGAKKIFDGQVQTIFFDFPDHRIKKAKDLLRLRRVGNSSFITLKKYVPDKTAKVRKEYEIEISDFSVAEEILKGLGCFPELSVKKHRESYQLNQVHFELDKHLDEYNYIPWFLEIETKDKETLSAYIHKLGFTKDQCKSWSFFEVADHYKTK
jgi:predicted adenylyl cyclase CyaB